MPPSIAAAEVATEPKKLELRSDVKGLSGFGGDLKLPKADLVWTPSLNRPAASTEIASGEPEWTAFVSAVGNVPGDPAPPTLKGKDDMKRDEWRGIGKQNSIPEGRSPDQWKY